LLLGQTSKCLQCPSITLWTFICIHNYLLSWLMQ
jgi:hypothetical protein